MNRKKIIQKKIDELKEKHEKIQADNKFAWGRYGSELCAGEMQGKEKSILEEIERLEKLLESPVVSLDNKILKEWENDRKNAILAIEEQKEELSKKIQREKDELEILKAIQKIF